MRSRRSLSGIRRAAGRWTVAMLLALPAVGGHPEVDAVEKVSPITVNINQSPWFEGFRRLVELYEKETGNKVNLNVNPYLGSLEASRNSVRAKEGFAHLLVIDNNWVVEFYAGGFLTPITEIDPSFRLDAGVNTYDDTVYWDATRKTFGAKTGKLLGVPVNGNVEVLFYREDLYREHGLKIPDIWAELRENAKKLHDPPRRYGIVHYDDRNFVMANFAAYLFSWGGGLFRDPKAGDFTVVINSPEALQAFEFYKDLGREAGHPSVGAISQGQAIEALVTGKAAHIVAVIAAWGQVDDPTKSVVVDKVNATVIPKGPRGDRASRAGHWIGAVPRNVPPEKQRAALEFLKWFVTRENQVKYTEFGAVPVRTDVAESDLAKQRRFRFLPALAQNSKIARMPYPLAEAPKVTEILNLRLNEALTGGRSSKDALNASAAEIHELLKGAGYKTGRLVDLR
ncbi:MAG: extracellular solute-binding protein [Candidatus Rokubacteria bacterium]|nr:extracellular solute-binding protein [Candidatus Rokubacteria bacterium]